MKIKRGESFYYIFVYSMLYLSSKIILSIFHNGVLGFWGFGVLGRIYKHVGRTPHADRLRRGRLRPLSRSARREPGRGGADPRRVPRQLRLRGERDRRQVACLPHPLTARGRRDRRDGRRRASWLREGWPDRAGDRARRRAVRRRARRLRPLPAAPGEHRPARAARSGALSPSSLRCSKPAAAALVSGSVSTPATCSPPAMRSAHRRR